MWSIEVIFQHLSTLMIKIQRLSIPSFFVASLFLFFHLSLAQTSFTLTSEIKNMINFVVVSKTCYIFMASCFKLCIVISFLVILILWNHLQEAKKARLEKFEIPAKIKVLSDPWTPETGLVTAALKLKRDIIRKTFQEDLAKLYAWSVCSFQQKKATSKQFSSGRV